MNKNIFITLLISLLLLSGCTGDTCIDPDDFGFIKFNVSARYDPEEITSRQEGNQVAPWRDSAYKVNGYPLTIMVRPWSYILGDKNTSGQLSAWCPWYGQKNNTTTLAAFCVKLQPCTFWDNSRLDMCTPNPANKNDAMISNAPCIMTNGVGLYFLIAAKNTDPNISPDSQSKPQGITQHLGEELTSGYEFYSTSSIGQFLEAGGINYQYKGEDKSKYAQSPLYFKIIDKFYNDNSGQYRLVIKSGVTDTRPDPLQFLTDLIKGVLFGKDGIIKKTYQQIIDTSGYRMSVSAILTLYIMFTGFSFLIGNINLTHVELIVRILKVSIVSILLSTDKAWTFFHDYLFVFFIDGVQQILQIINEASATGPGSQSLLGLLIAPQTLSKLFSLLFVDWLGFIYIILYLIALYFIFFLIFKATIIYLTALITIGMIIIMGPIFICFMLFNITRSLFENWLRQLISYALQPIILFTGIAFISMIIRTEIYSTLGFAVCKHDFPNLGPINEIFGSFLEDIDPSLGHSIFYWWFPVPMKGGINNFHKANILVPKDHIIVDDSCKNDPDKCKHCAAYECIDERYIELPFLDLVKDAKRISNFINGKFVQLDGILLIFVSIYLLSKFNDTAISTAQFIAGTSGNLTEIQKVNQQSYESAAQQMNRPLNYVAKTVSAPVTSRVSAGKEQVRMFFAEKFENMMMGRLEKQALGSSANKTVQNEVKRKYGIDSKDVKMNAITDYENGIAGLLKNLPKGNELKAKELSHMKFTQLRDKIAANKYEVKDYAALSKEQKAELDKSLKDANLRELASDANFTRDYQDAYKNAHQEMSGRGVGLFGKNIGVLRSWQEIEHRVDTKRKLKEEKRVGIGEKIYAGYTGIKRGALTAIVGKDLRDAYEGNLTSAEWHDFEYNDPRLRTYSEKLKDDEKAREHEELQMHINKEALAAQADILSPEYLARLEKAGRHSDVEYYQELAQRKLIHEVHGRLFEEGEPVMMGDRFMREKATDSQMRDMIDNAHRKHAEFIDGDRYIRRQEHYDIMYEKAQENLEQTYKELKDHFKRDDIKIEEMPALIAQKVKDTAEEAEIDQKITEELNNFNADVKNYEYSTEVLNKIEDRKQAITDEVNAQIDKINKYRENAKMQTYVKPIVNEGRKLRKLEDHLRNMK
ncbi:type IV secretion system protein [Rickettsia rickettsii]|uniref:Channel protein n=1 Tax=Rickettsia rickettsii (strain Iowa) TaxID=452659 RepID=B0BW75_RICRO|nr:type IV secretion system protein [Rickettsia rickettsii]ABY72101.1 channel protein [Rickettsia rickettsii str. Iowa]AFB22682.1 channel protein [Rickettsia rickettsii str. Brazil]AFB23083.1 channel protein [Rickettsia rickettsii str. Colombia]AFB24436.1 channel protein [Rickettsia rickettsii str. Arizona]AFB27121.1 channel protein [Rickettsia rickettsii str. Hino]